MASARLQVTVESANNLYNADGILAGKSDPYVIVEVPGQENMKFQTNVMNNTLNPMWNYTVEIDGFMAEDELQFTVMDKDTFPKPDDFLGKVSLTADDFYPDGFHAEIPLSESKTNATLTVMITVIGCNEPGTVMVEEGGGVEIACAGEQGAVEEQTQYVNVVNAEEQMAQRGMVTGEVMAGPDAPGTVTITAPMSTYAAVNVPGQSHYSGSPVTYSGFPTTQTMTCGAPQSASIPMMSQPSLTYSAPGYAPHLSQHGGDPNWSSGAGGQTGKVTQVIVHAPKTVTAQEFAQSNGTIVSTSLPVTVATGARGILETIEDAIKNPINTKKKSKGCCC